MMLHHFLSISVISLLSVEHAKGQRPRTPLIPPKIDNPCPNPGESCQFSRITAFQNVHAFGAHGNFTQPQPKLGSQDAHTLAELAIISRNITGLQIIEVGWTIDSQLNNKDLRPHLFVYHWINGVGKDYNDRNGDFVINSNSPKKPGDPVTVTDTGIAYSIKHDDNNNRWVINYDGNELGYFNDSLWSNSFTSFDTIEWFGEVATYKMQVSRNSDIPGRSVPDEELSSPIVRRSGSYRLPRGVRVCGIELANRARSASPVSY